MALDTFVLLRTRQCWGKAEGEKAVWCKVLVASRNCAVSYKIKESPFTQSAQCSVNRKNKFSLKCAVIAAPPEVILFHS